MDENKRLIYRNIGGGGGYIWQQPKGKGRLAAALENSDLASYLAGLAGADTGAGFTPDSTECDAVVRS